MSNVVDLTMQHSLDPHSVSDLSTLTLGDEFELPDPFESERDQQWYSELVAFIGRLALQRERFCRPVYRQDLVPALLATVDLVNDLVMFISEHGDWEESSVCLNHSLEQASAYIASATAITKPHKKSWSSFLKSKKSDMCVHDSGKLFYEFTNVLEQGFLALGDRFQMMDFKLLWIKSCGVFLSEIRADLRWAEPTQASNH